MNAIRLYIKNTNNNYNLTINTNFDFNGNILKYPLLLFY